MSYCCYETLATYERWLEEVTQEEKADVAQKFTQKVLDAQSSLALDLEDGSGNWDNDPERLRKVLGHVCDWLPREVMEDALKPIDDLSPSLPSYYEDRKRLDQVFLDKICQFQLSSSLGKRLPSFRSRKSDYVD